MVVGLMDQAVKGDQVDSNDSVVQIIMDDVTHLQGKTALVERQLATELEKLHNLVTSLDLQRQDLSELQEQKVVLENVVGGMIAKNEAQRTLMIKKSF